MAPRPETFTGDRAFVIDLAAVAAVGGAICAASDALVFMTIFVAAVVVARLAAWARLPACERGISMNGELFFFGLCLILGAANDWNSVVRHRIYDYDVPHFSAATQGIPVWMLLYWGIILRFVATLCRWQRLAPPPHARDALHLGARVRSAPRLKLTVEIVLVLGTRQLLYRHYLDPVLSWAPFAAALLVYVALFRPSRHERILMALAAVAGPAVEIAFIRAGNLHHYHLGWLEGVPLWIVLWWVLAVLIWNDVSARLLGALATARLGPRCGNAGKILLAAVIIAALIAGLRAIHAQQHLLDLVSWIRGAGWMGLCVFVIAYVCATVLFLPGSILTLGAGFAYGVGLGTVLVWIAANAGAALAFVLGRTLARKWVAARMEARPRFAAIDRAVGREGFKIVLLTRLSPVFPFNLLNYAFGLTRVSLRDYVLGSLVGMLPGTVMYVYLGSLITSLSELAAGRTSGGATQQIFYFAGLAATVVVTLYVTRVARRALEEATAAPSVHLSGQGDPS
jgi:uncharacterized membrane protein YdjX (TVP38/TMEM64 family)